MSYRAQKKNTTKLPKALRDELVSLGKLDPHRSAKKRPQAHRRGLRDALSKKPSYARTPTTATGRSSAEGHQQLKKYAKKPIQDEEPLSEEEEPFNDEDRIIADLEKKLGLDKRKSSKLGDDELDGLLDGIGVSNRGTKRKADLEISDSTKKRALQESDGDSSNNGSSGELGEESEFEGFSDRSDSPEVSKPEPQPVAPQGKYIPPAARKAQSTALPSQSDDPRLKKQIQGLINRLSESNMATILSEIEGLYRTHPRANVTSTLTTLLLSILSAEKSLLETFVILHAGFVAALYRIMGTDFCAYLVQNLVEEFEKVHHQFGKESINLVGFLSELYNFGVVGAGLIYDLIRLFLENLSEVDTELLLKIVQNSGQQLRQDDPSALKEIVILMQSKVSSQPLESLSVRTKFMTETIINLKNNRAKAATATSVVNSEATVRMKKFLGKLSEKGARSGGEPLRVTLNDIRNVNEKGKWWLVGASWKNDELNLQPESRGQEDEDALLSLAKEQRMNTEIRRAVFIAVMGSEDYIDASTRIQLLPLKKAQRAEISRVIVHCCSNESLYNPFYALVAKRLCSPSGDPKISRAVRMGLQFNLWSVFREWGETTDDAWMEEDSDELDEAAKLRKAVNLAKLYGSLVADSVLSLQILKVLGFVNLQPLTKSFLEIFFTQLILHSQGNVSMSRNSEPLLRCAHKLNDTVALAKGIDWYLRKKNVEKAGIAEGEAASCVAWGVGVLRKGISEILEEL